MKKAYLYSVCCLVLVAAVCTAEIDKGLVGTWVHEDDSTYTEFTFVEDGTFTLLFKGPEGTEQTSGGTWEVNDGVIAMVNSDSGREGSMKYEVTSADSIVLYIGEEPRTLTRKKE